MTYPATRERRPLPTTAAQKVSRPDTSVQPHPDDIPEPMRCEAAGIYCMALGILELEAAGRARLCCRHYLYDAAVSG